MTGLGETFAGIVTDGSLLVAFAVAALVGLISFASPCCLPLVPGYVGYIAGLAGSEARTHELASVRAGSAPAGTVDAPGAVALGTVADRRTGRRRMLFGSLLFVSGFSAVFVSFGALFGGLGRLSWSGRRY